MFVKFAIPHVIYIVRNVLPFILLFVGFINMALAVWNRKQELSQLDEEEENKEIVDDKPKRGRPKRVRKIKRINIS
jgi:hypothetical protein